jgi:hypothetical protein
VSEDSSALHQLRHRCPTGSRAGSGSFWIGPVGEGDVVTFRNLSRARIRVPAIRRKVTEGNNVPFLRETTGKMTHYRRAHGGNGAAAELIFATPFRAAPAGRRS